MRHSYEMYVYCIELNLFTLRATCDSVIIITFSRNCILEAVNLISHYHETAHTHAHVLHTGMQRKTHAAPNILKKCIHKAYKVSPKVFAQRIVFFCLFASSMKIFALTLGTPYGEQSEKQPITGKE